MVAIAATDFSGLDGSLDQHEFGAVLPSHSHRSLRAKPKKRKSRTPSPPKVVGLQTTGQASLHLPPVVAVVPDQRNARWRLSI